MNGAVTLMLTGTHIRLEPLEHRHLDGLVAAASADPSLYQWSPVPQGERDTSQYIDTAIAWREAGSAVPFAIVRISDGTVIGSTASGTWNGGRGRRAIRVTAVVPSTAARSATPG